MNGEGKKHTLRFDPRTELLLLVLANIVAFTQHSVWVEITWVVFLLLLIVACGCQKSAGKLAIAFGICLALQYYVFPNGPKILASSFTIIVSYARKIFPCLIVGTMVLQKTPVRELMVALRKWHIPQGLIIPLSVTVRYFPALKEETGYMQFAPHGGHWCVCQRPPGGAQRPPSLRYFDRLNNNNVMLRCPLHNSVG